LSWARLTSNAESMPAVTAIFSSRKLEDHLSCPAHLAINLHYIAPW